VSPASFAAQIESLLEERFRRAPEPGNPLAGLVAGALPPRELGACIQRVARWVLALDRGLLPRVLRMSPDLSCGVRLSPVVARGYGVDRPARAHPALIGRLLDVLGIPAGDDGADSEGAANADSRPTLERAANADSEGAANADSRPTLERAANADSEADAMGRLGWLESVAVLLADRAAGAAAGAPVAAALRRHYGVPDDSIGYFQDQAEHGADACDALLGILGEYARFDEERAAVVRRLGAALAEPPLVWCACALGPDPFLLRTAKETSHARAPRP
jgi:hypothetical protein